MFVAVVAVLTWWACNAFIPLLGSTLAAEHAVRAGLSPAAARLLAAGWQARASNAFNFGGLIGALAAVPLARLFGRRVLFVVYFLFSAAAIGATFGLELPPQTRLTLLLLVGAGVYGVFGAAHFLSAGTVPGAPARDRCRLLLQHRARLRRRRSASSWEWVTAAAGGSSGALIGILSWVALVPLTAALLARAILVETRGRALAP